MFVPRLDHFCGYKTWSFAKRLLCMGRSWLLPHVKLNMGFFTWLHFVASYMRIVSHSRSWPNLAGYLSQSALSSIPTMHLPSRFDHHFGDESLWRNVAKTQEYWLVSSIVVLWSGVLSLMICLGTPQYLTTFLKNNLEASSTIQSFMHGVKFTYLENRSITTMIYSNPSDLRNALMKSIVTESMAAPQLVMARINQQVVCSPPCLVGRPSKCWHRVSLERNLGCDNAGERIKTELWCTDAAAKKFLPLYHFILFCLPFFT